MLAQDLTLRPIPGPEHVELASNNWWLWFIPVVLIGFLWFWWLRRPVTRELTPQERLEQALMDSEDTTVDPRTRYQLLHCAIREYLVSYDPAWVSMTAGESLAAWRRLFPHRTELAEMLNVEWIKAETMIYGPAIITESEVVGYALHIGKLRLELCSNKDEELKKICQA